MGLQQRRQRRTFDVAVVGRNRHEIFLADRRRAVLVERDVAEDQTAAGVEVEKGVGRMSAVRSEVAPYGRRRAVQLAAQSADAGRGSGRQRSVLGRDPDAVGQLAGRREQIGPTKSRL